MFQVSYIFGLLRRVVIIPILSVRLREDVYLAMRKFEDVDWSKIATNYFKKVLWEISEETVELSVNEWQQHLEVALTRNVTVNEDLLLLAKSTLLSVPRFMADVEDIQRIQSHGMLLSQIIPRIIWNISEITYSQIVTQYMSPFTGALRHDWEPIFVEKPFKIDEKLFEKILELLERGSTEIKVAEPQLMFSVESSSPFIFIESPATFRKILRKKKILSNLIPRLGYIFEISDEGETKESSMSSEKVLEAVENVRLTIYASLPKIKQIMLHPEIIRWVETPIPSKMWSNLSEELAFTRELASRHIRGTAIKIVLTEKLPEIIESPLEGDILTNIIAEAEKIVKRIVKIENTTFTFNLPSG